MKVGYVQKMGDHRLPKKVLNWIPQYRRKLGRSRVGKQEYAKL